MIYALLVILTFDATPPPPSWHATREACERQAAVEVTHYELTARPVALAQCQRVRAVTMRPVTGEALR
jgi:hypothetical protein